MISYAQNFEDVMIARLFPRDYRGFYIDIGAADPVYLSVTKHFYDCGWSGVNVEPLPHFFERLEANRTRDVNLRAAVGSVEGRGEFFEVIELRENSTSNKEVMSLLKEQGRTIRSHDVELITLKEICERFAGDRVIDFMKLDIEGGELEVLQSADWQRFRPIVLVIEGVVVNGRQQNWMSWESVVVEHGYQKVWFDGLNNFYLRHESLHLKEHFQLPPNVFDGLATARLKSAGNEWVDVDEMLKVNDADLQTKQEIIDRLVEENADRQAKQEVIDRLGEENAAIRAAVDDKRRENAALKQEVEALRNSTSYKITYPLRLSATMVRKWITKR
jgi:FkbM family methyltransferase